MEIDFKERICVQNGKLFLDGERVGYSETESALEKYVIEETPLGAGANGITFRVFHKKLKVYQVLKLYFPKDEMGDSILNKAEQEAIKNANTKLNGVIAVVFDAGVFEYPVRLGYSMMESVEHFCTFKDFRKESRFTFDLDGVPFDFENKKHKNYLGTALNLAAGFLNAVLTLYEKDVIDGDLNPGNILWIMKKEKLEDYAKTYSINLGELIAAHVKLIDMGSSALSEDDDEGKARDSYFVFDTIRSLLSPAFSFSFKNWFSFSVKPDKRITDRFGLEYCPHYEEDGKISIIPPMMIASMMLRLIVALNYILGTVDNGIKSYIKPDIRPEVWEGDIGYLNDLMHGEILDDLPVQSSEINDLLKGICTKSHAVNLIKWETVFSTFPMCLANVDMLIEAHRRDVDEETM